MKTVILRLPEDCRGVQERHIWIEGRGAETWAEMVKAIRPGDCVAVDGLHRIGQSREAGHRAILDVIEKGGRVLDAGIGHEADARVFASVFRGKGATSQTYGTTQGSPTADWLARGHWGSAFGRN